MDRFFAEEFRDEIETVYRALLSTKREELKLLENDNKVKREELAKLYVDYQLANYHNNTEEAKKIDEQHTEKWNEYSNYESEYLSKKSSLEKMIKLITSRYPDK